MGKILKRIDQHLAAWQCMPDQRILPPVLPPCRGAPSLKSCRGEGPGKGSTGQAGKILKRIDQQTSE